MLPELQIRLLGAPSILLDGRPLTGFISNKAPALIYFLAATGRAQMRDLLATLLWTDTPDVYAKKNLRNILSNLRDLLGPFLEITRSTVCVKLETVVLIDSLGFSAKIKAAQQATLDAAKRSALLAEAVALYQGPLLNGFHISDAEAFEEWARNEREHFQLLALQILNDLIAHHAQQGELLSGINYASRLLSLDPLREETHRQLMLMFALDGQPSVALAQYRTCQQILRQELGVQPNLETQQLFERIRTGEFKKKAPPAVTPPAALPSMLPPPLRHNLPAEFSTFVGRTAELQQLQRQLQDSDCRLLTITGLGGVGKTRLAVAAAQAMADATSTPFPAGIWFVPLAGLEAIGQVENLLATTLAESLQIPLTGSAPTLQLSQALYDKMLLLVLDSFEHLAAATPFITTLLQGTRHIKLLITSRTRLNLRGEQVMSLDGLALPPAALLAQGGMAVTPAQIAALLDSYPATQLFVQHARNVATHFTLDRATASAIVRICQLVQGLPLGIELAATWVRLLSCAEIAAEIAHNLDFLDSSLAEGPLQQQSLRVVFNHSWLLLAAAEQQCLRQLSIFRGGFTRAATTAVAGATLPLLAAFVDKSFVRRSDSAPQANVDDNAGAIRYELPEVIRQYAAEQLAQAGEQEIVAARYADYYTRLLAAQRLGIQGAGQPAALQAIAVEIENIRVAWQWSSEHLSADGLAQLDHSLDALFHFYDMRSWFQQGATVFAQTAATLAAYLLSGDEDLRATIVWAKLQARQGWFAFHLGQPAESRRLLEESLARLRNLATAEAIFNLNYLGAVLRHLGEFAAAQTHLQEALVLAQQYNDPLGASIALNNLAQLATVQGNTDQARALLGQALFRKRQIGDRWGLTYSLAYMGRITQEAGDYGAAEKLFDESLAICREIGDQRGTAFALQNLGDTASGAGQVSKAQAHYQESLRIYRSIGNRAEASLTLSRLGEATCVAGDYVLAAAQLHEALALAESVQATPGLLAAVLGLAALAIATGQLEQAIPPLRLVYHHAASSQLQKKQAAQWLKATGASAEVPPTVAELDLATYVQTRLETI